jgi:glycosyltransferase involved in cell wall biosynthesis
VIVGIDARESGGPQADQAIGAAGRGRYVHELVKRLPYLAPETRFLLYTNTEGVEHRAENAESRVIHPAGFRWHWAAARQARRECDIYFSTMTYLTSQLLDRYVQTVFDLIPFKALAHPHPRAGRIERLTAGRALRRARAILAISQSTARDLVDLFPELADRVTVTPLAADTRFRPDLPASEIQATKNRYGLPDGYVLTTGTIEPRKNLARLVEAHVGLAPEVRRAYPLVLAGKKGRQYEPVLNAIERAGNSVLHLDFVPDDDLARLYAGATVFCYPSLYEGFGLPVLEAMRAGAPVITSNVSSLPEVGGEAARYVDPYDVAGMTHALAGLLGDPNARVRLRAAGLERAQCFSWDRTARRTLEILHAAQ